MPREKKISFQLYLEGKPTLVTGDEEYYKVYLRINFNGDSTKIPTAWGGYESLCWPKDDMLNWKNGENLLLDKEVAELLEEVKYRYEKFIRYEYSKEGDQYSMKGLSQRAKLYEKSVTNFLIQQVEFLAFIRETIKNENIDVHSIRGKVNILNQVLAGSSSQDNGYLINLMELFALLNNKNKYGTDDRLLGDSIFSYIALNGFDKFSDFMNNFFDTKRRRKIQEDKEHSLAKGFIPKQSKEKIYFNLLSVCVHTMRDQLEI